MHMKIISKSNSNTILFPLHYKVLCMFQTSASECVLVTMLAARAQAIKRLKQQHPFVEEGVLLSKLMAYCSKEAHSCVEKAAMISFVKMRILEPDDRCCLRGNTLRQVRSPSPALVLKQLLDRPFRFPRDHENRGEDYQTYPIAWCRT